MTNQKAPLILNPVRQGQTVLISDLGRKPQGYLAQNPDYAHLPSLRGFE